MSTNKYLKHFISGSHIEFWSNEAEEELSLPLKILNIFKQRLRANNVNMNGFSNLNKMELLVLF